MELATMHESIPAIEGSGELCEVRAGHGLHGAQRRQRLGVDADHAEALGEHGSSGAWVDALAFAAVPVRTSALSTEEALLASRRSHGIKPGRIEDPPLEARQVLPQDGGHHGHQHVFPADQSQESLYSNDRRASRAVQNVGQKYTHGWQTGLCGQRLRAPSDQAEHRPSRTHDVDPARAAPDHVVHDPDQAVQKGESVPILWVECHHRQLDAEHADCAVVANRLDNTRGRPICQPSRHASVPSLQNCEERQHANVHLLEVDRWDEHPADDGHVQGVAPALDGRRQARGLLPGHCAGVVHEAVLADGLSFQKDTPQGQAHLRECPAAAIADRARHARRCHTHPTTTSAAL
mmetsp:Transcript_113083/g.365457  ORF Transcript_113083/g.365457 Transcript_113083/m.365457 type:complete len:349 (-) Transcript_113083:26-1072(-)